MLQRRDVACCALPSMRIAAAAGGRTRSFASRRVQRDPDGWPSNRGPAAWRSAAGPRAASELSSRPACRDGSGPRDRSSSGAAESSMIAAQHTSHSLRSAIAAITTPRLWVMIDHRHAEQLAGQVFHQFQNLGLDRDVERRRRLVRDNQFGLAGRAPLRSSRAGASRPKGGADTGSMRWRGGSEMPTIGPSVSSEQRRRPLSRYSPVWCSMIGLGRTALPMDSTGD